MKIISDLKKPLTIFEKNLRCLTWYSEYDSEQSLYETVVSEQSLYQTVVSDSHGMIAPENERNLTVSLSYHENTNIIINVAGNIKFIIYLFYKNTKVLLDIFIIKKRSNCWKVTVHIILTNSILKIH